MLSQSAAAISSPDRKPTTRWDIQALRGWAIALVIIDHAKLPLFEGGFLGVDIFFVISGFLMTGLIVRAIDNGTFTLGDFYSRRARRLLPAAYSTIIATALFAPFVLDPYELHDFVAQVIGSLTFTVNYVLWQQIDYFNNLANLKPLLHMWSLSLEEQYYLAVPVLLLLCSRRMRMPVTVALTLGSLAFCIYLTARSPSAAFYFLPTRAWELGIGSAMALLATRWRPNPVARPLILLRWLSIAVLVAVPIAFDATGHPGLPAMAVCAATAWLVLFPVTSDAGAPARLLAWVGDRSYSLYLLHWPLFAFANNMFLREPDMATRVALIGLCFILAEFQYRFVEIPFRHRKLSRSYVMILVALPMVTIGGVAATSAIGVKGGEDFRVRNAGLSTACVYGDDFAPRKECQTSDKPTVLVWGDSFGMHVTPAVVAGTKRGVLQATRPVCGPFLGVAPINGGQYKDAWARSCIAFNDSVLAYVGKHPEIEVVALSSALAQYVPGGPERWTLMARDGRELSDDQAVLAALKASVGETISRLQSLGKKVVFYAPPPAYDFDLGRCLQRKMEGLPVLPTSASCDFKRSDFETYKGYLRTFVSELEASGLKVLRFDDVICDTNLCHAAIEGVPLYRDEAHLSIVGSRLLGTKLPLDGVFPPDGGN